MSGSSERQRASSGASQPPTASPLLQPIFIRAASILIAVVVLYSVFVLARPLAILLASIIIAAALAPIVKFLERWLPRSLAAVAAYATILLLALGILTTIGATIVIELRSVIEQMPDDREGLVSVVAENLPISEERAEGLIPRQATDIAQVPLEIPLMVVSATFEIVIAFFLSIYWLLAAPRIHRFALSLIPPGERRHHVAEIIRSISHKMGGYVRGIALDGVFLGIVTYIGLMIIDVRFPIALALLAGLAVLVPIIGPVAAAIPAILLAFVDSPLKALIVLIFYVVLQQVESNIILPNIMRRQAQIDPLLAVFAVFTGGTIGNILGALIAVPTAGAIQVLVTQFAAPILRDRFEINATGGDEGETDAEG
ncbi:MAG: AI-2E family transporter [Chloroflexota bacterium]